MRMCVHVCACVICGYANDGVWDECWEMVNDTVRVVVWGDVVWWYGVVMLECRGRMRCENLKR